ncbi:DUF2017 family protein [Demequina lignilytica]|uniref:DUF2017 family protein n=1 Tax=Demequina lignilytica TaxID=3051663 RepID=A0AAW7M9Q4_9MICO|nr:MULTISPECIES: DUF2017 family protein [unclassified Demequina]MDN4478890.1 DUF2017 family protein [Demequina sp. SYSU T00039-1]MDN4483061.1 DUF2017 family protein [Demequina sp. SYSU T0a273]MDN4488765.1 DUF2017 family protein [Demequina sp. SYSU T00039]MDN4491851.1 DUF2017 family protein [Demequina sp. SYSU T00068]
MRAFVVRDHEAVAGLDEDERLVIARIVADVGLLLGAESFGHGEARTPERDDLASVMRFLERLDDAAVEPDDPALLRLLPNAAPDDREVADEFRRLTHQDIRDGKIDRLRRVWEQLSAPGDEWAVPSDEVMATAAALTDVRLVVASRLGIESDEDAEALHRDIAEASAGLRTADPEDLGLDPERLWLGMLYDALTWLQESLVSLRIGGSDE